MFQVRVLHQDPWLPQLDLIILGKSHHFIGNCVSSFTAFVSRERLVNKKPTSFWGFSSLWILEYLNRYCRRRLQGQSDRSGLGSKAIPANSGKDWRLDRLRCFGWTWLSDRVLVTSCLCVALLYVPIFTHVISFTFTIFRNC